MVISSVVQVNDILVKNPKEVFFKITDYGDDFNFEWSQRFNSILKECGCGSGQQYIMYAAPVYLLGLIGMVSYTSLNRIVIVAIIAGLVIITGLTGKVVGLRNKRKKIEMLIEHFYLENPL